MIYDNKKIFAYLKNYLVEQGLMVMDGFIDYYLASEFRVEEGSDYSLQIKVDYGGSEGIYMDCRLQYFTNNEPMVEECLTVKTLEDSNEALEKMYLYAARIQYSFPVILRQEERRQWKLRDIQDVSYAILQCSELSGCQYMSYNYCLNKYGRVTLSDYHVVYSGKYPCFTGEASLTQLHALANKGLLKGCPGLTLSVSDIIEIIYPDGKEEFYYLDTEKFLYIEVEKGKE